MSQEFKDHMEAGEQYTCDKCNDKTLDANEYDSYIKFQYHYCEPCWNYMRLKRGTCICGSTMTNRSEDAETSVVCGCGREVVLKW